MCVCVRKPWEICLVCEPSASIKTKAFPIHAGATAAAASADSSSSGSSRDAAESLRLRQRRRHLNAFRFSFSVCRLPLNRTLWRGESRTNNAIVVSSTRAMCVPCDRCLCLVCVCVCSCSLCALAWSSLLLRIPSPSLYALVSVSVSPFIHFLQFIECSTLGSTNQMTATSSLFVLVLMFVSLLFSHWSRPVIWSTSQSQSLSLSPPAISLHFALFLLVSLKVVVWERSITNIHTPREICVVPGPLEKNRFFFIPCSKS